MKIKQETDSPPMTDGVSTLAHVWTDVQGMQSWPWTRENDAGTDARTAPLQHQDRQQPPPPSQQQQQQQAMCAYKHGEDDMEDDSTDCKRRRTVLPADEKMARRRWQNSQAARRFREKNRAKAIENKQRQAATEQENQRLMLETQSLSIENQRLLLENLKWKTLANTDVDARMRKQVAEKLQSLSVEQLSEHLAALQRQANTYGPPECLSVAMATEPPQSTSGPVFSTQIPWNQWSHPGPFLDAGLPHEAMTNVIIQKQTFSGLPPGQPSPSGMHQKGRSFNVAYQTLFPSTRPRPDLASSWTQPPQTTSRRTPPQRGCNGTFSPREHVNGGCSQQTRTGGTFPQQATLRTSQPTVTGTQHDEEATFVRRLPPLPPTHGVIPQEAMTGLHLAVARSLLQRQTSSIFSPLTPTSGMVSHQETQGTRQPATVSGPFQQAPSSRASSPLASTCEMIAMTETHGTCQHMVSGQSYSQQAASGGMYSQPTTSTSNSETHASRLNMHGSPPSSRTKHPQATSTITDVHLPCDKPSLHRLQEEETPATSSTFPPQVASTPNGTTAQQATPGCNERNVPRATSESSIVSVQQAVMPGVDRQQNNASAQQQQILLDDMEQILQNSSFGFCEWLDSPSDDSLLPNLDYVLSLSDNWEQDLHVVLDS